MPEVKPEIGSQKLPGGSTDSNKSSTSSAGDAPKTTSTGTVKSPQTGNTASASSSDPSAKKDGVITGDRKEDAKTASQLANTPTSKAIAEEERKKANEPAPNQEPLSKEITEINGELLQGDSFQITFKRGKQTFQIPVPIEGSSNAVILDNTFRIIKAIQEAKSSDELEDKFASFIKG